MIGRQWVYSLLPAAVVGLMAIGCSGEVGDDKPREPVSGTVTLDGQPLPEGIILFAPAGGPGEAVASATGKIENGQFSIPRTQGPVPGNYKVSISHTDQPEGRVKIELKKPGKKTRSERIDPREVQLPDHAHGRDPQGRQERPEFPPRIPIEVSRDLGSDSSCSGRGR